MHNPFMQIASLATVTSLMLVSGCQTLTSNKANAPANESLNTKAFDTDAETGFLINNSLLSLSESGLFLNNQPLYSGRLEYGDQRGDTYISFDAAKSQLVAVSIQNQTVTQIKNSASIELALEGLCLYQPEQEPLQLFLLSENQMAHQYWLGLDDQQLSLNAVRSFPVPPGAEYCAADDKSQTLFVSEEGVGVWAYPANAEKEMVRTPVDLVVPFGQLAADAGPIAMAPTGHILIAGVGSSEIQAYAAANPMDDTLSDGKAYQMVKHWQLVGDFAAETLTANQGSEGLSLLLFDDHTGQLASTQISLPAIKASSSAAENGIKNLMANAETTPVDTDGDAADDPAIWVNPSQPEASRILGTNKKSGLFVYDLSGNQLQNLAVGRVNNVDVRNGFTLQGQPVDIATASQRDNKAISLFAIDQGNGHVSWAGEIKTGLDDVYGLCMYQNSENQIFTFINDQDGRFEQYQIIDSSEGWQGQLVREFRVASQPEGCVAHDQRAELFLGEENVAIWRLALDDQHSKPEKIISASDSLVADIEGMSLYHQPRKEQGAEGETQSYLVVSSQGNDSYVLYDSLPPYQMRGRFRIGMNPENQIDGASETDGLDVTSAYLGEGYPQGLLVVQDGRNLMPQEYQNFKLVDWRDIQVIIQE